MFSPKVKFSQTILKTRFGLKIDLEGFQLPQLSTMPRLMNLYLRTKYLQTQSPCGSIQFEMSKSLGLILLQRVDLLKTKTMVSDKYLESGIIIVKMSFYRYNNPMDSA